MKNLKKGSRPRRTEKNVASTGTGRGFLQGVPVGHAAGGGYCRMGGSSPADGSRSSCAACPSSPAAGASSSAPRYWTGVLAGPADDSGGDGVSLTAELYGSDRQRRARVPEPTVDSPPDGGHVPTGLRNSAQDAIGGVHRTEFGQDVMQL